MPHLAPPTSRPQPSALHPAIPSFRRQQRQPQHESYTLLALLSQELTIQKSVRELATGNQGPVSPILSKPIILAKEDQAPGLAPRGMLLYCKTLQFGWEEGC